MFRFGQADEGHPLRVVQEEEAIAVAALQVRLRVLVRTVCSATSVAQVAAVADKAG